MSVLNFNLGPESLSSGLVAVALLRAGLFRALVSLKSPKAGHGLKLRPVVLTHTDVLTTEI